MTDQEWADACADQLEKVERSRGLDSDEETANRTALLNARIQLEQVSALRELRDEVKRIGTILYDLERERRI